MADKGEGARQATILSYSSGKPTSPDSKVLYIKRQLCTRHWGAEAASSVLSAEAQIHVGKRNGEGGRNIRATVGPQTMSQTNMVGLGVGHPCTRHSEYAVSDCCWATLKCLSRQY